MEIYRFDDGKMTSIFWSFLGEIGKVLSWMERRENIVNRHLRAVMWSHMCCIFLNSWSSLVVVSHLWDFDLIFITAFWKISTCAISIWPLPFGPHLVSTSLTLLNALMLVFAIPTTLVNWRKAWSVSLVWGPCRIFK